MTAPTKADSRRAASTRRRSLGTMILGILILLYPIVATQINDYQLQKQAESYARDVGRIDPPGQRDQYLKQARDYNAWLAAQGHHAMPPTPGSEGFDLYMRTLNAPETGNVMARLRIPSINVDLPVFHTTAPSVLYGGAGHMFGSSLPVGGPGTNAVISAHTGMVNASMFDNLPRLKNGEIVTVEVMGEVLNYKVVGRQVVKPEDYGAVQYDPAKDRITLITCTPYGINTDRLLVTAERVDLSSTADDAGWRPKLSWWMILALVLIALVLLIVWVNERRRRRRREASGRTGNVAGHS